MSRMLSPIGKSSTVLRLASALKVQPLYPETTNGLDNLHHNILEQLRIKTLPDSFKGSDKLLPIASYYFDGQGKSFRPKIVFNVSQALSGNQVINDTSMKIAMIAEMIHTGSLVHDDVIDKSDKRRGKDSANAKWGVEPAVMAGNFIISHSSQLLASLNNDEVTKIISRIIDDLIHGELCQLESVVSTHEARYKQYLTKTYLKTASLIANSCEAVALMLETDSGVQKAAFNFGKYLGLAFQIQDDRLDFISNSSQLGKPACADLKLGLSTAPVLFACQEYQSEMFPLMKRRFSKSGDVEFAFDIITNKSDALLKTRLLAEQFATKAAKEIDYITSDPIMKERLLALTKKVTNRDK